MSRAAVLKVHFRNEETLRNLEQAAHKLGISADELAETAIERELASIGAGLERKLGGILDRLKSRGRGAGERGDLELRPLRGGIRRSLSGQAREAPTTLTA